MVGGARYDSGSLPSVREAARRSIRVRGYLMATLAALAVASFCGSSALSAPTSADNAEEWFWDTIKDSKTDALFKVYLQQYPNSAHSAEAQERIKELSAPPAQPPQEQPSPTPAPPPAPDAAPQLSPAPPATPEQQAKPIHAIFYAKPKAVLRAAPASDGKVRRHLYAREVLKVDLQSEDGQWYHVGGAHGGWVEVASTVDAKTAEGEAWREAARSSRDDDLRAYLKQFPRGGHAKEAKERLAAKADAAAPADDSREGQGATPEERAALASVTKMLRDDNGPAPQAPHQSTANPDSAVGTPPGAGASAAAPRGLPAEGTSQEARLEPGPESQASTPAFPHGNALAQYNAALGMLAGGQIKAGEEGLESIIKEFPSDPIIANVRYRLGETYFNQQDYEHALTQLQLAHDLDPKSAEAPLELYEIAVSKGYRGETQEACSQLQSVGGAYDGKVEYLEERISEVQKIFKCAR